MGMELKTCPIHSSSPEAELLRCRPAVDKSYADENGMPKKYRLREITRWRVRCRECLEKDGPFGKGFGAGVRGKTFEEAAEKWNRKCMDAAVKAVKKAAMGAAPS